MPTLKIDISTRFLDDQMQVYLIHPGARYVFYDIISKDSVLPVDLPFFDIPDKESVPDANKISSMLERARIMRKWAKRPKSKIRAPMPTRCLDHYKSSINIEAGAQGARTRLRNVAQEILWNMREGSLVVIPQKGITSQAILAELGASNAARFRIQGQDHYADLNFLARPVKIINRVPMLALPPDVINVARSTTAVQNIDEHSESRILRLAYGDYHRNKDSVAGVKSSNQDFDALVVGQMIDLHVTIEHFLKTREVLSPGQAMWAQQINNTPHLHATINSPDGHASLESQGNTTLVVKLFAIIAASIVVSGITPANASEMITAGNVNVVNTQELDKNTEIVKISQKTLVDFCTAAGYDRCKEYLIGLQNGINRNAINPQGKAEIE